MASILDGKRVAVVATDGFEQSELLEPKKALEAAGAKAEIVSPKTGAIRSWSHKDWGEECKVDRQIDSANPEDYDALVLPGGVMNPDHLRVEPRVVEFVKTICESG